jgi:hypothetical protein
MRESGFAVGRTLWRGIVCVAALISIGVAVPVDPVSAGIVKEATDRVESTVAAVDETVNALPPPPKVVPSPPPPPSPSAAPRIPSRPAGNAPSAPTSETPQAPLLPQPGSGKAAPSGDGISRAAAGASGRAAAGASGSDTTAGGEAADRVAGSRPDGDFPSARSSGDPAAAGEETRLGATAAARRSPLSVRPADVAAVRRWIARIWPGVPLGGGSDGGGILTAVGTELLRPAITAVARSLLAVAGVARAVGDGGASPVGTPAKPSAPHGFLSNVASPTTWTQIPYLVAIAALLALLAFTIWREFRSALHPHPR